jgi:hypothetical protein
MPLLFVLLLSLHAKEGHSTKHHLQLLTVKRILSATFVCISLAHRRNSLFVCAWSEPEAIKHIQQRIYTALCQSHVHEVKLLQTDCVLDKHASIKSGNPATPSENIQTLHLSPLVRVEINEATRYSSTCMLSNCFPTSPPTFQPSFLQLLLA